jgi:hypothetical protein
MAARSQTPSAPRRPPRLWIARQRLLVALLAIVCALVTALVDARVPRIAAALVLVLGTPGYALTALIFPSPRLDGAERALTILGTSLVVAALGGLLLDVLPGHMSRAAWALMLAVVTLCATGAAALRPPPQEDVAPASVEPETQAEVRADGWYSSLARVVVNAALGILALARTVVNVALGILALALAAGALALTLHSANRHVGFAELSTLPAPSAHKRQLLVRLRSDELHRTPFTITIREDRRVPRVSHITLGPGEEWRIVTKPLRRSTRVVRTDVFGLGAVRPLLHNVYYPARRKTPATRPLPFLEPSASRTNPRSDHRHES